jgi:hypothetical protein
LEEASMNKLVAFVIGMAAASLLLSADIYIKTVSHRDSATYMEITIPEQDTIMEQWVSGKKFAMVADPLTYIVDLARNSAIFLIPASKTYVETTLPIDMIKLMPPEFADMAAMLQYTATVKPSGETKKIGAWNCAGYDVAVSMRGSPLAMKIWATTDVPFDLTKYEEMLGAVQKAQMFLGEATVKEFAKIKGIQVATETTGEINGVQMRMTTEVVEISQRDAPRGIYEVPAGFTKKATLSLEDLQRR